MKDQINEAVAKIFADYEDTPELRDFKEEIAMNMTDRVQDMMGKGASQTEAVSKAVRELGDISEAADAVSRQRRKEIIGHAYMQSIPLDKAHAVGYPLAGAILLFGVIIAAMRGFSADSLGIIFAALMPFAVPAGMAFVWLGLTQETRTNNPMSRKRSLAYAVAAGLILFGLFISLFQLFDNVTFAQLSREGASTMGQRLDVGNPVGSLGVLIAFVLPGLALLAFLVLTQQNRKKTWVIKLAEQEAEKSLAQYDEKFGMLSGALWMFAVALFVLLGLLISWRISWVVFLFATAAQCILNYFAIKD